MISFLHLNKYTMICYFLQFDKGSKNTDTRKFSRDTLEVLKEAAKQDSELNKKIEELMKK